MTRISRLPRRDWTESATAELCQGLSDMLRTEYGTQVLRPVQSIALIEAAEQRGLFAHIRVGGGKTLISGLLPEVMGAKRPMLFVPGALLKKTAREFGKLRSHWRIPVDYRVESYSKLAMPLDTSRDMLDAYQPDLIVLDEGQKCKRVKQSVAARRINRYLVSNPPCRVCVMSGTLTKGSILDYAHLLYWSLRERSPLPLLREEQEQWASVLDAKPLKRSEPDSLVSDLGPCETLEDAREAYRDRLNDTPGVVISVDSYEGATLNILPEVVRHKSEDLDRAFNDLRTLWEAPDGWPFADQRFEVWACARQLALGFYYMHDPRPPKPWFNARRDWCSLVREILSYSETLDSQLQVWEACEGGKCSAVARQIWESWAEIQPTYKPNTVPVWISDKAVEAAAAWGESQPGIIFAEHAAFAERLHTMTKWPIYGAGGRQTHGPCRGKYIEDIKSSERVIASVQANKEGRNLQHSHWRALVAAVLPGGDEWEQLLGRLHREEQPKDEVRYTYFVTCHESITSLEKAHREACYAQETLRQPQKLVTSNLVWPDLPRELGPAFQPTKG